MKNLGDFRKSYTSGELTKADLTPDPMDMFARWWQDCLDAEVEEPNAMTLATANAEGQPSARTVLLKGSTAEGFEFFTNYESRKAHDMAENPKVTLLFFWQKLERQVRIEGVVEKLSSEKSAAYFQSRPLGSQIGAWASPQSSVISDRDVLNDKIISIEEKFRGQDPLPAPPHWGGYLVRPTSFEFWQGRDDRLHDRFQYRKDSEGRWIAERLAP